MKGVENLSKKASKKSISIYLIGSPYRNKALELTKEWFRPYDLALKNLIEEAGNARKLNHEITQYIKNRSLQNTTFLDPLQILDKGCGKNMETFLQCFRDGDHLSEKSSRELIYFLMRNYLRPYND